MAALRTAFVRGACSSLFQGSKCIRPSAAFVPKNLGIHHRCASINLPTNLKYTSSHEWVDVQEDNVARVGITDFAQTELGEIVFVDVSPSSEALQTGANFGCLEAVKTVSDLVMPVQGEVVEVNSELESTPDLINKQPYEDGWIAKIKLSNPSEVDSLLDHEGYRKLVDN
ncbi:glycine cleavage system H protein-like [Sycon ciliatum]|uniref:glycine cleavage system H protein-like n=1 Tax=Sycon ciliatum TaxID=27933 RepID=UPI0031F6771F